MRQTHKIPELIDPHALHTGNGQEAWRVLGIMAEFAIATERLRGIRPAVSVFGSARIPAGHPYYEKTKRIARLLSDAGFAVISGGGSGIMRSRRRGAVPILYGIPPPGRRRRPDGADTEDGAAAADGVA